MTLLRTPQIVRKKLDEIEAALLDLKKLSPQDRSASLIDICLKTIDDARRELADAVCDAEAAMRRL